MSTPTYFRAWMLQWPWGIRIVLLLFLVTGVIQFVVFGMSQNYVVGYFGAQPEDVSFALQITYCGIIAALPFQFRFVRYFQTRNMMAVVLLLGILLSLTNLFITDIYIFICLRLLTGFVVAGTATPVLIMIFSRLPGNKIQITGFSVFFGTLLCAGVAVGILGAWVVSNMDWKNVYYYLAMIQAGVLLLSLVVLNPKNNIKKYPLYQLDWTSAMLCVTALIAFAYTFIYGPAHDWFDDKTLIFTALLSALSFALLFYRQSLLKRPYIHLDTFKSLNFFAGILLLMFFYTVKDSINLIYAYSAGVLQWPAEQLITLACFNVAGIVLAIWMVAELNILKILTNQAAFISGFVLMLIYHIWMYFNYSSDISFFELIIPVFLQGAACGTLFVPIIRFVVSTAPHYTGFSATVMAAVARFLSSVLSISVFYSMQRYYNLVNKQVLLRNLTDLDDNFTGRLSEQMQLFQSKGFNAGQAQSLATAAINRSLTIQSQLRTNMDVFRIMIYLLILVLVIICIAPLIRKRSQSI